MYNENKTDDKKSKHLRIKLRPRAFVCAGAAVVIIFLAVFAAKVATYAKIYPNVSVMGTELGGMTKEEAEEAVLKNYYEVLKSKEFKLRLEDREKTFSANSIDASVDCKKTAENAYNFGRGGGFFSKLSAYMGKKKSVEPVCTADSEKISALVDGVAEGLESPVKEESFSLSGTTLVIEKGSSGKKVNREKAEKDIKTAVFTLSQNPVELKIEKAEPKEVDAEEFYKKIISSEKNAYYERENGEIVIREGFPKIEVDKDKIKAALKSQKETYEIEVAVTPPEVTAAQLKAMLFRDKMGSWTSNFSAANKGRTQNVKLSASRINGVTLLPGEVFSYDKTIGSRTAANGYQTASVYVGNKVEDGIGGGICQTSSTLYSAVLYSNLEIVSRTSHSLPVSYMPPGQDATIAEGSIDFKFKNNSNYPIKIVCSTGAASVTCSIYGVKTPGQSVEIINTKTADFEPKTTRTTDDTMPAGYKKIKQKGAPGYAYSSQRIVKLNGVEQKRENLTKSTYKALDTIEIVNPSDKDTPSGELLIYSLQAASTTEKEDQTKPAAAEQPPSAEGQTDGASAETGDKQTAETEASAADI